jgi:hypothetical protein
MMNALDIIKQIHNEEGEKKVAPVATFIIIIHDPNKGRDTQLTVKSSDSIYDVKS